MSTLGLTRSYAEGEPLLEADLDNIQTGLTTFFNTTGVSTDNIQTESITGSTKLIDATITSTEFEAGTVGSSKIADTAVTTAKINDGSVTTIKIEDGAVTAGLLGSTSVTTAKLGTGSVTTAKITAANVTQAKREALPTASTISEFEEFAHEYTVLEVVIRTSVPAGRPQLVSLQGATTAAPTTTRALGSLRLVTDANIHPTITVKIEVSSDLGVTYPLTIYEANADLDAGLGGISTHNSSWSYDLPVNLFWAVHIPPSAGTYYYRFSARGYDKDNPTVDYAFATVSSTHINSMQ